MNYAAVPPRVLERAQEAASLGAWGNLGSGPSSGMAGYMSLGESLSSFWNLVSPRKNQFN